MIFKALVRKGEYRDSVALMLVAREIGASRGVTNASVVMGTPANKAILHQAGLVNTIVDAAGPTDLVIAIQAEDEASATAAQEKASDLLAKKGSAAGQTTGQSRQPRSMKSAVRLFPNANIAVISVPGQYAAAQAWDALRAGLSVLLFSDHVELADEIALKEYARDHGLLVMGPGAGTAIINGIGLGFANSVPRGPVGIVAAAGTGLQEISTLIAKGGSGITQGIGVGGRDVKEAVGGIMILEGLKALQADPDTRVIVLVSKLPSSCVTGKIVEQVHHSSKPTVLALMSSKPQDLKANALLPASDSTWIATDLREAAALALALAQGENVDKARLRLAREDRAIEIKARSLRTRLNDKQRYARGLYSGGTLCEETMRLWQENLGRVWSNAPLDPRFQLPDSNKSKGHTAIDLGEEEFTIGRPHPMIDNSLRIRRLLLEARDPSVAAIVLDVVLGYGAHPDPVSELGPAIAEAKRGAKKQGRELYIISSVTGTESDPQGLTRETDALKRAGAIVMTSNAAAARLACALVC